MARREVEAVLKEGRSDWRARIRIVETMDGGKDDSSSLMQRDPSGKEDWIALFMVLILGIL